MKYVLADDGQVYTSINEAAEDLGITVPALEHAFSADGDGPGCCVLNGRLFYSKESYNRFMENALAGLSYESSPVAENDDSVAVSSADPAVVSSQTETTNTSAMMDISKLSREDLEQYAITLQQQLLAHGVTPFMPPQSEPETASMDVSSNNQQGTVPMDTANSANGSPWYNTDLFPPKTKSDHFNDSMALNSKSLVLEPNDSVGKSVTLQLLTQTIGVPLWSIRTAWKANNRTGSEFTGKLVFTQSSQDLFLFFSGDSQTN
jgi:hypothetical protein